MCEYESWLFLYVQCKYENFFFYIISCSAWLLHSRFLFIHFHQLGLYFLQTLHLKMFQIIRAERKQLDLLECLENVSPHVQKASLGTSNWWLPLTLTLIQARIYMRLSHLVILPIRQSGHFFFSFFDDIFHWWCAYVKTINSAHGITGNHQTTDCLTTAYMTCVWLSACFLSIS